VLQDIRAPAGARVQPGAVLAVLSDESAGNERAQAEQAPAEAQAEARISPIAARIAGEHGIDLAQVPGTGFGGRIIKSDVLALVNRDETQACESPIELTPASREPWRARAEWATGRRQTVPHVSSFL